MAKQTGPTVAQHFATAAPHVRATYDAIVSRARLLGPVGIEPKKTSIHLLHVNAFAGIATRRSVLILTLKSASPIKIARVLRAEQASAHRWHVEFRLESPADIDREMSRWIAHAYELAGPKPRAEPRSS